MIDTTLTPYQVNYPSKAQIIERCWNRPKGRFFAYRIHYRLGCLSGRLRAYEREEDLKNLIMKSKKLIEKRTSNETVSGKGSRVMKDNKEREFIL